MMYSHVLHTGTPLRDISLFPKKDTTGDDESVQVPAPIPFDPAAVMFKYDHVVYVCMALY